MDVLFGIGKLLIIAGLLIAVAGVALVLLPHVPFLGKLPGDILISPRQRDRLLSPCHHDHRERCAHYLTKSAVQVLPMRTEDFSYVLPEALIAQEPTDPRDSSRLLVLHRDSGELEHRGFRDIVDYLRPGDVIVRNDSRVVAARLLGRRASGGKVEALLLRQNGDAATWEALVKPASRVRVGSAVEFTDQRDGSPVPAEVTAALPEGTRLLRFPSGVQPDLMGLLPLPPYIHRPVEDPERYQTVYARDPGSAAAPTAGLHFTPELLRKVEQMGVEVLSVTLHVGLDTFRPVRHDDPRAHGIHQEFYQLSAAVAQRLTMAAP